MDNISNIYDESGNLIEKKRFNEQGDLIEEEGFDEDGNILYHVITEYTDFNGTKSIEHDYKTIYEYNEKGCKIKEEDFHNGDLFSSITFDEHGNKIKEKKATTSIWNFEILTYDKNGRIIEKVNEHYYQDSLEESDITTYEYDNNGNKIKEEYDGGYYKTFEYDEYGNITREGQYDVYVTFDPDDDDYNPVTSVDKSKVITYIYDKNGILIKQDEKDFKYYFNDRMENILDEICEKQYHQGVLLKENNYDYKGNLVKSYWYFHEENTSIYTFITSIDDSEDEIYTPNGRSFLTIVYKENGKLVERQKYICEYRDNKRFKLRIIQTETWQYDERDKIIEHVSCNYRQGRREAYDSSGELLWTDAILFLSSQRGSQKASLENHLVIKTIKDPWGNSYTLGEKMWEDFIIKKSYEHEYQDESDYNENDDEYSDNHNNEEIDPMEIRRDAWGNPYSVGEKMFEDYMNRNNNDDDD